MLSHPALASETCTVAVARAKIGLLMFCGMDSWACAKLLCQCSESWYDADVSFLISKSLVVCENVYLPSCSFNHVVTCLHWR